MGLGLPRTTNRINRRKRPQNQLQRRNRKNGRQKIQRSLQKQSLDLRQRMANLHRKNREMGKLGRRLQNNGQLLHRIRMVGIQTALRQRLPLRRRKSPTLLPTMLNPPSKIRNRNGQLLQNHKRPKHHSKIQNAPKYQIPNTKYLANLRTRLDNDTMDPPKQPRTNSPSRPNLRLRKRQIRQQHIHSRKKLTRKILQVQKRIRNHKRSKRKRTRRKTIRTTLPLFQRQPKFLQIPSSRLRNSRRRNRNRSHRPSIRRRRQRNL